MAAPGCKTTLLVYVVAPKPLRGLVGDDHKRSLERSAVLTLERGVLLERAVCDCARNPEGAALMRLARLRGDSAMASVMAAFRFDQMLAPKPPMGFDGRRCMRKPV